MKIRILGMGAIGVYLMHVFTKQSHSTSFFDPRRNHETQLLKAQINGNLIQWQASGSSQVSEDDEIIIVALKSYQISASLKELLIESEKEILYLQNGISQYSTFRSSLNRFHFGTIYGIQANREAGIAVINSSNCRIAAIAGKANERVEDLRRSSISDSLCWDVQEQSREIYYAKFVRWFVSSLICSHHKRSLGPSLASTNASELDSLIMIILKAIQLDSDISFSSDMIKASLSSLPKNLLTSATRDYQHNKQSEMLIELDYLIDILKRNNIQTDILNLWKDRLLSV